MKKYKNLGFYIRRYRRYKDLTLDDIGDVVGLSRSYLSLIESGKRSPSIEILAAICKAIEIPMSGVISQWENQND